MKGVLSVIASLIISGGEGLIFLAHSLVPLLFHYSFTTPLSALSDEIDPGFPDVIENHGLLCLCQEHL